MAPCAGGSSSAWSASPARFLTGTAESRSSPCIGSWKSCGWERSCRPGENSPLAPSRFLLEIRHGDRHDSVGLHEGDAASLGGADGPGFSSSPRCVDNPCGVGKKLNR